MGYMEFEDLLMRNEIIKEKSAESLKAEEGRKLLKSNKGAKMLDFIKMLDRIITLTMSDLDVKFIPEEGNVSFVSSDRPLDRPTINYKIKSRRAKNELKPRFRESFNDEDNEGFGRIGEIYGQKFVYHLQFNVFASVYTTAETVMERFEEMILTYAGYFKKNGVGEIIFDEQFTDDSLEKLRQTLSIRSFSYYVEMEKLTVIIREKIKEIDIF